MPISSSRKPSSASLDVLQSHTRETACTCETMSICIVHDGRNTIGCRRESHRLSTKNEQRTKGPHLLSPVAADCGKPHRACTAGARS